MRGGPPAGDPLAVYQGLVTGTDGHCTRLRNAQSERWREYDTLRQSYERMKTAYHKRASLTHTYNR